MRQGKWTLSLCQRLRENTIFRFGEWCSEDGHGEIQRGCQTGQANLQVDTAVQKVANGKEPLR